MSITRPSLIWNDAHRLALLGQLHIFLLKPAWSTFNHCKPILMKGTTKTYSAKPAGNENLLYWTLSLNAVLILPFRRAQICNLWRDLWVWQPQDKTTDTSISKRGEMLLPPYKQQDSESLLLQGGTGHSDTWPPHHSASQRMLPHSPPGIWDAWCLNDCDCLKWIVQCSIAHVPAPPFLIFQHT